MRTTRAAFFLTLATFLAAPAWAGSVGVYGSHWSADQADDAWGGGARVGFTFVKMLELEFHGTRYTGFRSDSVAGGIDLEATPVDGGLRVNFLPSLAVNPYVGAGVSYYFLNASDGSVDNDTGLYGEAGLEFGGAHTRFFVEGMWRRLDTSISFNAFNSSVKFDGTAINAGFTWRWGS